MPYCFACGKRFLGSLRRFYIHHSSLLRKTTFGITQGFSLSRNVSTIRFYIFFSPVILIQVLNGKHHKNYKQSMLFRNFVMLAFICLVKKSTMTSDAYKSIYLLVFIFKNRVNHLVQNNQSTNFQFSL